MKFVLKDVPVIGKNNIPRPAASGEEKIKALKFVRSLLLSATDWTQLQNCPLGDDEKTAWEDWRQELRDITDLISSENAEDYFEVSEPPSRGVLDAVMEWEYEKFLEIRSVFAQMGQGMHQ